MSCADTLEYRYTFASLLRKEANHDELTLADYSELDKKSAPHFFSGPLGNPYIVARALLTLSNVVKSSFNLSPAELARIKDPIATVGAGTIRFEGFSQCAGVYARVDVTEEEQKEAFLANGTTNVDFNQEMLSALGMVTRDAPLTLDVGKSEVAVTTEHAKVVEKKVPLPAKWIKGLTTVQHYMSESDPFCHLNRLQAMQLFRTIPKGQIKTDYYLISRGGKYLFSPMSAAGSFPIGGLHRLQLLTPLLPLLTELRVFMHRKGQSSTWQFYFDRVVFSLSLSRETWRGFSGEGALLEELMETISPDLVTKLDNFAYANQAFSPTMLNVRLGERAVDAAALTGKLAAMGLLGYDLDRSQFFYRQLPFKPERILTLNPRLKGARKLIDTRKVRITHNEKGRVEARVEGSGVEHLVVITEGAAKCTCQWYSKHRGERGDCKHVLAVKEMVKNV